MAATAGVILSIGSKFGPGGLASLQAGIQMIGQLAGALRGVFDEAWKYDDMVRQLQVDISMADKATKGLIDTTELVRGAMKFQAAQMKISEKQLRDIAVAAEDMSGKLGTDATEEFNKLTDAITKGQTRALKQYGLDLENTSDLLAAQAEGLQKVTDLGSQLTTEYENLGDRLYALDNSLGTLRNTALASIETWEGFNEVVEAFAEGANKLTENVGSIGVAGTLAWGIDNVRVGITGMTWDFLAATGAVDDLIAKMAKLQQIERLSERATERTMGGQSWNQIVGGMDGGAGPDVIGLAADAGPAGGSKPKRKGGGGGGAAKQAPDLASMTAEQRIGVFAQELAAQQQMAKIDAERAAFLEMNEALSMSIAGSTIEANLSNEETWEIERREQARDLAYEEAKMAYLSQYAESETEQWERERQADLEEEARQERKLAYLDQYNERYQSSFEDFMFGEENYRAASEATWKQSMSTKLQMVGSLVSGWSGLMDKENKKQFRAWQALAITESVIAGLVGSMEAFKSLAGIPYVGPILGAIAAASVLAQTAVTVAKIKNTKYKGGGSSANAGGGFNVNTGSSGAGSAPEQTQQPTKLEITNIVNLDGEKVYENVKTHNDGALRAGRGGAFSKAS